MYIYIYICVYIYIYIYIYVCIYIYIYVYICLIKADMTEGTNYMDESELPRDITRHDESEVCGPVFFRLVNCIANTWGLVEQVSNCQIGLGFTYGSGDL